MEHEVAYRFKATQSRPVKRRRVLPGGLQTSWATRKRAYDELWPAQRNRIQTALDHVNHETVDGVSHFAFQAQDVRRSGKVPVALVITGSSITSWTSFLGSLSDRLTSSRANLVVSLRSGESPNLKTLLRVLIAKASAGGDSGNEDETLLHHNTGRLLNYDLQLLEDLLRERATENVVIAFEESETFDGALLSDTINLISSWVDRIPFMIIFSVATTLENLQHRISRGSLRHTEGRTFSIAPASEVLELALDIAVRGDSIPLWVGCSVSNMIMARQKDYFQCTDLLIDSLQYAYMSHFYANPLSIFLLEDLQYAAVPRDHFEALRNLGSFRRHVESILEIENGADVVRALLESDERLFQYARDGVSRARALVKGLVAAVHLLHTLRSHVPRLDHITLSSLYIRGLAGELNLSPPVRELLLSIKMVPSNVLPRLLEEVLRHSSNNSDLALVELQQRLKTLTSCRTAPLRSHHDTHGETIRTTIVAQKVELSKQKSRISEDDSAYSEIVDQFHDYLERHFMRTFLRPENIFMHEIVIYDLKSPHRDVFMPRPRFAIERALSLPHDYLDCSCCHPTAGGSNLENTLSASQPATSILYQLYMESGPLINVADLWLAFDAVVGGTNNQEAAVMTQFQRALAELRYLGMIRPSRRKADHVTKVSWKGL
ncbi:origin recognition complex subunit 3 N-terminus-domain-containing protein [Lineolata rhizophorae]|uniref:Origin recognition complex subunit 3 N-terminus-domain-containing protein n=1 Tax=Lineolata rhizophorae TaxID=578093 RepID=A0A6A6P934_9PEZI|nr:origin recognition complex subunit 3 N-terminus-domain-containing protein [Lineolata rhizophorae]